MHPIFQFYLEVSRRTCISGKDFWQKLTKTKERARKKHKQLKDIKSNCSNQLLSHHNHTGLEISLLARKQLI